MCSACSAGDNDAGRDGLPVEMARTLGSARRERLPWPHRAECRKKRPRREGECAGAIVARRERQAGASAELQAKVRFPTTQTYSMPQCKTASVEPDSRGNVGGGPAFYLKPSHAELG